jgi:hypothetical protein
LVLAASRLCTRSRVPQLAAMPDFSAMICTIALRALVSHASHTAACR